MLRRIWKFFCSVKLTVVLFTLILIPSIIGTFIQQNASDPSQYVEIYGPTWDRVFRYLGFYDIYHDLRFIVLLVMLGLNTFACTFHRFRPQWRLLGMMMTHFGLLLILMGALSGAIFGVKGFMVIAEGETTDQMSIGRATRTMGTVPFKVKLIDFILDLHDEPAHRLMVLDVKTNKQESHSIEEGKIIRLPQPGWARPASLLGISPKLVGTIRVKRLLPNAVVVTSFAEGPEATGIPAVEFRIMDDATEERGFALPRMEHPYVFGKARLGVGYLKLATKDSIDEQVRRAVSLSKAGNRLEVTVPGKIAQKTYPAEVGSKLDIEGTDYSVEVLRYVPDFVIDFNTREVTSRSNLPNNPAIQVRITGPAGSKDQWIFSKFPGAHNVGDAPIELKLRRNEHLDNIVDYILLLDPTDAKPALVHIRSGKVVTKTEVDTGRPVTIEGTGYRLVVDKFFENANMTREIANRPDRPNNRPAIEISVEQYRSSKPYHLWEGTPTDVNGYKLMYAREDRIRDFYSILQILDGDKVVAEKKIEVNDPLRHEGYALYQSSYDQEGLNWSGLQVKKDPGVPLVYAGFLMQILGMIIIFYVNPLLRKTKKSRA